ncbi:MAG: hypothetical protein NC320_03100 [Clostridium sp.]|nr:hypothetical protein [Clostridium sp.]
MKIYSNKNINASSNDPTTTNLADFGARERHELIEILQAWESSGLPDNFYDNEVVPMFNRNSGSVFLTNSEYQVCMVVDGRLESWYTTPYSGYEGFLEDLVAEYMSDPDSWDEEDVEYLCDLGADV